MTALRLLLFLVPLLLLATESGAQSRRRAATTETTPTPATAPVEFAPLPDGHPLAGIWNDPEFTRRLLLSYAPLPEVEPRLTPEERTTFTEKIVPLLRDDHEKAIRELQVLIKPQASALFEFTLGNLHFQSGDFTNAVRYFDQATTKFPPYRRAWQNLGFALARDGKYDEAIAPLSRAIALGGTDSKLFGLLGFCYLSADRPVSAEAAYRQGMLLEPDNTDYKLGIIKSLIAQQHYTPALALVEELLRAFPDQEQFWTIQANLFLQTDQATKAAVNYELLRRLGKATPDSLARLGDIYMTQDARALALEAYLEAIQQSGGTQLQRSIRAAEIMVGRGAWEESRQIIARIRATAPDGLPEDDELKLLKLESKMTLATGDTTNALLVLERIIERNPLDGEALLLAGDASLRAGDRERAQFRYETAAKLEGFEADAYVKLAQVRVQAGQYADAMELLRKAQKVRPRDNVQRYLESVARVARAPAR